MTEDVISATVSIRSCKLDRRAHERGSRTFVHAAMSADAIALVVGTSLAGFVGMFAHLIGYDRDRAFYAVVLTVVGSLYVLFAAMAGGGQALLPEIACFTIFAALAAIGFRISLWLVVAGLALHGAFDFVRHAFLPAPGAPQWWPAFCGSYDVIAALGLALLLLHERERAGHRTVPGEP